MPLSLSHLIHSLPPYALPLFCRTLSTLLCAIVIVSPTTAHLAGASPFFIMQFKETNYNPGIGLGAQVEATILCSLGALCGLAYGNGLLALSRYFARRDGTDSISSRATVAISISLVAFVAIYTSSKLNRLSRALNTCIYLSIWILLTKVGDQTMSITTLSEPAFCVYAAAGLSLFASLPLLLSTETPLASAVNHALGTVRDLLQLSTDEVFRPTTYDANTPDLSPPPSRQPELDTLSTTLFRQSQSLPTTYILAQLELRFGRLPASPLKPLITSIDHLRAHISLALPGVLAAEEAREGEGGVGGAFLSAVEPAARALIDEVGHALDLCQAAITLAYEVYVPPTPEPIDLVGATSPLPLLPTPDTCVSSRSAVVDASTALRKAVTLALSQLLDDAEEGRAMMVLQGDGEAYKGVVEELFRREMFGACLWVSSLLEVASEVWVSLKAAEDMLRTYDATPKRKLQRPQLTWEWLGVAELEGGGAVGGGVTVDVMPEAYHYDEPHSAIQSQTSLEAKRGTSELHARPPPRRFAFLHRIWTKFISKTLHMRLKIAGWLKAVQHSRHVKFALRAALGGMIFTVPAVLPKGSPSREWFEGTKGQMMVIGFVMGLDIDVGATLRKGLFRIMGTVVGCAYGFLAYIIARRNPYARVIMITAWQVPCGWWILNSTSLSGAGTTAAVTAATIVFGEYKDNYNISAMGLKKAQGICIGIGAAMLAQYLIFPSPARTAFMDQIAKSVDQLSKDYVALSRPFLKSQSVPQDYVALGLTLENKVKARLRFADRLLNDMGLEISLLPKPIAYYSQIETNIRRILDLFVGLRSLRQNITHHVTVSDVLDSRMHLTSSQIMIMFALSHAFRSQMPLPQFLPSSQHALTELITNMKERFTDDDGENAKNIASMYALAESEAMTEVAEALDELTQLTTSIFGSVEWWDGNSPMTALPRNEKHYWYRVWKDIAHHKQHDE